MTGAAWYLGWFVTKGSQFSGNYGHKGRKGKRGGSLPGAGHGAIGITPAMSKEEIEQAIDTHQEARAKETGKLGPLIRKRLARSDAKYEARALELMRERGDIRYDIEKQQERLNSLFDMRQNAKDSGMGQRSIDFWQHEIDQNMEGAQALFERSIAVENEFSELRQKQRAASLAAISVPKDQQANVTLDTRIRIGREGVQEGVDAFNQLVGTGTVDGETVSVGRTPSRRAAYVPIGSPKNSGRVILSKGDRATTMLHEMGHWLEDRDPKMHERALAFLDRRTKGETAQKLSVITGNSSYRDNEIAKPDKFMSAYSGKQYYYEDMGRYASEIISMGLQHMFEGAANFAQKDPDYFDFMINVLRG